MPQKNPRTGVTYLAKEIRKPGTKLSDLAKSLQIILKYLALRRHQGAGMKPKDEELRVKAHWRPVAQEPSPLWRRLWARLLSDRKISPASTREAAANGGCKDGEQRNLQD